MSAQTAAAERYVTEMDKLAKLGRDAATIDIDWLLATVGRAHTVGPILDPTGYRDGLGRLRDQERLLRAAKPFRDAVFAMLREGPS